MADVNISDLVVIRVDGGICSQIAFVALGLHLKRKFGEAVRVKYDLSWFRECGKDIDGRFVRNWDMPKAFPGLSLEEATAEETAALAAHRYDGRDAEAIAAPAYVGAYPDRRASFREQREYLRRSFCPELSEHSQKLLAAMQAGPCCALHVRRGDLANYTLAYGQPASLRYFSNAVQLVRLAQPDARFFFFSDEPRYVHDELLPALPQGPEYVVAEGNGSDRGYEDLYLISRAQYIVASIGSLGRVAAKLSPDCRCIVLLRSHGGADDYGCEKIALDDVPDEQPTVPRAIPGGSWPVRLECRLFNLLRERLMRKGLLK